MKHFKLRFISLLLAFLMTFSFPVSAESNDGLIPNIKSLIEMLLKDSYYYKLEGNETGFIIQIADEGVAMGAVSVLYGIQDRASWDSYVANTVNYANSFSNFIKECGIDNPNLLFIVLDDMSMNTTLLAIYNGAVIYDFTYGQVPNK